MRRGAVAESVQHAAEAGFDFRSRVAGDGKGLDHDVRSVVADGARRQLDAVADDVVLVGLDGQRVLRLKRFHAALRHRERVVAEVDQAGFLVQFVHREVGDPAEAELALGDQAELVAELGPDLTGEFRRFVLLACGEEDGVAGVEAAGDADGFGAVGFQVAGDRALGTLGVENDVAEAAGALFAGPFVQLVEEAARVGAGARRRDGADDAAGGGDLGEQAEAGVGELFGDVADADRVAQVGLVGAEAEQGFVVGDAHEGRLGDAAAIGEFLEHAGDDGFDGVEDVFLGDVAHLEIELVELAGAAVGAGGFVAETGGDLEVAVEAGDHGELFELLRRLRQGVELAGVVAGGDQEVPRAFRRGGGEDRGLEFSEAAFDHPAADRGDDAGAQHDVLVHALAAEIEEAVGQAQLVGVFLLGVHLHRQHFGKRLHLDLGGLQLDLAGGQAGVHCITLTGDNRAGDSDHAFEADAVDDGEGRGVCSEDDLGDAVMVAQIDKEQAAMVALAVHPAGKAGGLAGIGCAKLAAGVGAIGVHLRNLS